MRKIDNGGTGASVASRTKKSRPSTSLAAINKKLAATRAQRLALAEENCIKMTGKNRL
jgi:hypothetical protein